MKKQQKPTSRRTFIREAGAAALIAAALEGNVFCAQSAAVGKKKKKARKNATTKKLAEISPQPPHSAFTVLKNRRLPGWRVDTADLPGQDDEEYFFPEEALRAYRRVPTNPDSELLFDFFPPPSIIEQVADPENPGQTKPLRVYFKEPPAGDSTGWNDFNRWVLGYPLNAPPQGTDQTFHKLVVEICDRVRRYNIALYLMRRLHFRQHAPENSPQYPPNDNGRDPTIEKPVDFPTQQQFLKQVEAAERKWIKAVDSLNDLLAMEDEKSRSFDDIRADMVEINGYIASVRVVADLPQTPLKEIGGSSSSHISISSAFSSPR